LLTLRYNCMTTRISSYLIWSHVMILTTACLVSVCKLDLLRHPSSVGLRTTCTIQSWGRFSVPRRPNVFIVAVH
jgi:hypothetical protein